MKLFRARPRRLVAMLIPVLLCWSFPALAGEIHQAVSAGDLARVAALLAADPALASLPDETPTRDLPLHLAASYGHLEIAKLLLEAGALVDGYDIDESTPLDVAALRRQAWMTAFLLERGADVNRRDKNGACPLSFAAFSGDSTVTRMLIDAGADLNFRSRQGATLLHAAALRGQLWLMDLMIGHGDEVDCATGAGETPLHWAARSGQAPAVARLLALGANPAQADTFGHTALQHAVLSNRPAAARALLAGGAAVNAVDRHGETPLITAAAMGRPEVAEILLASGADVNHVSESGHTALFWAVQRGGAPTARALLEAGAKAETRDPATGRTPLHLAAMNGHGDLAEMLLEHGASPSVKDQEGIAPTDLAARYGHGKVLDLLVGRGAKAVPLSAEGRPAAPGTLDSGEMKIWNLGHSGWAVQTAGRLLIFDYAVMGRPADQPALCNGGIDPEEIAGLETTVFVSHAHNDHFDPRIFELSGKIPKLNYVFGFTPDRATRADLPEALPAHEVMGPRETREFDGVKVTTIESNDSGVGFLVEVDGVAVYHAGDHANRQRDFSGPFTAEIEFLAATGVRPDVAFLPVSGCGFGDLEAVRLGNDLVLETLKPVLALPMHGGDLARGYREFVEGCGDRFPVTQLRAVEHRGDCVTYRKGKVS